MVLVAQLCYSLIFFHHLSLSFLLLLISCIKQAKIPEHVVTFLYIIFETESMQFQDFYFFFSQMATASRF
jgi:hypothetical protein